MHLIGMYIHWRTFYTELDSMCLYIMRFREHVGQQRKLVVAPLHCKALLLLINSKAGL
jgi:hypothetical protein